VDRVILGALDIWVAKAGGASNILDSRPITGEQCRDYLGRAGRVSLNEGVQT